MINLNEYILEKFKISKEADVDDKYSFFIDCIAEIPDFYKHVDEIATYYKKWIDHFKIDTKKLGFDCTEDVQKYVSAKVFKQFGQVIEKGEEDDYFTGVDLDGCREYYIYEQIDNIYIYCHENTFAVTGDNSCIFANCW